MEYQRSYSSSSSSHSNHHQSRLTSLTSQRSLASVPSLNHRNHRPSTTTTTTYHHCLTTLKGHNTSSYTSSLTLNGKFLYSGSSDREIRSWNRTTPLHHHPEFTNSYSDSSSDSNMVVIAGKGSIKSLVIQSDKLFSAHQDHKIRVWKISNNHDHDDQHKYSRVATLPTLGDRAFKGLIPKNHVQIRRHKKCTWVHHVDTVSALALSKDGTFLYSVSWDRTIKIWRTKDFTCLESLRNAHDDAINAVAVSHDGIIYSGSADKKIKVWKKFQGEKKHTLLDTLEKHNSGINALALSCDESILYSGACDRSILIWEKNEEGEGDDDDGKMVVVGALRGHTKSILCLVVVSDLVFSGSADKTIRIWKGNNNNNVGREYSCLAVLEGHNGPIKCITAVVDHHSSDNSSESEACFLVYSGSLDCDIKVWQILVNDL